MRAPVAEAVPTGVSGGKRKRVTPGYAISNGVRLMFRKTMIVLATIAVLALAQLVTQRLGDLRFGHFCTSLGLVERGGDGFRLFGILRAKSTSIFNQSKRCSEPFES
jgi:hypothetical protein